VSRSQKSRKTILVLKTGEALHPVKAAYGDFEDWIARGMGCAVADLEVAHVYLGQTLPEASTLRGVVVTGSPEMVTERADWSEASGRWLAEIVRGDAIPVLGLCYGHQLLAHALGGEVGRNPNGREMGTYDVTFLADSADAGAPDPPGLAPLFEAGVFPGHLSHLESVLKPPPGARVLARTVLDPHAAIRFGPRQWGVQFHPEFDVPIMQRYVEARQDTLIQEGFDPAAMIEATTETSALTRVLERFAAFTRDQG
jgi:GMP synthase (glutamine-hydrolysing)